jgi:hypothetical protein
LKDTNFTQKKYVGKRVKQKPNSGKEEEEERRTLRNS